MNQVDVKGPRECSDREREEFLKLVVQGGEVATKGLPNRIMTAEALGFLRVDDRLVGIAAVKNPSDKYRNKISDHSGFSLPEQTFLYELGWIFIAPAARGNKYSFHLAKDVITTVAGAGIFATSRSDNVAMHRVLDELGFQASGTAYKSTHGEYELRLFTKTT